MTIGSKLVNFVSGGAVERARRAEIETKRARKSVDKKIAEIEARYEAGYWSTARSYLPGFIQGAREDVNNMERSEVLRRVRYFEKNSDVMTKALDVLNINVVGSGINPSPATVDAKWNKQALDAWNEWSEVADITGESSIPQLQSIVFRAENVDGDHGVELTLNEYGRPALNLIEAHRVTSAGIDVNKLTAGGYKIVDGVLISPFSGRPLVYMVASDFDSKTVAAVAGSGMVFFYKKTRAGQYRGISLFHGAVIDLHDLDDLQKFEMRAAKDASSIARVVQTASGGTTVDGNGIGRSLRPAPTVAGPAQMNEYYKTALGGEVIHTFPGDKVEQFQSNRPNPATIEFWTKLETKFARASGLSYAALVDYQGNWGGAALRAAVTSDNRLFSLRTTEQARKWQRVWEYFIGWKMDHGELTKNPDFRNVRWHPPRRTTVDIGHESQAMLEELKGGLRTYETIYGEAGDEWKERLEQRAIEEQYIEGLATKYKIPRQLIASFAQERLAGQAPDAVGPTPAPNGNAPALNGNRMNQ